MRYQPVKIRQIFAVQYVEATKPWHQFNCGIPDGAGGTVRGSYRKKDGTVMVATGRTKRYWVVSCNLLGDCGHKHKTEASAQPCARRFKKQWHDHRSKQAKKAAKQRTKLTNKVSNEPMETWTPRQPVSVNGELRYDYKDDPKSW